MSLDGTTILEISLGGPAYTSRQLSVGDVILKVNDTSVTASNVHSLLQGSDVPGSPLMITAGKGGAKVHSVIILRSAFDFVWLILVCTISGSPGQRKDHSDGYGRSQEQSADVHTLGITAGNPFIC